MISDEEELAELQSIYDAVGGDNLGVKLMVRYWHLYSLVPKFMSSAGMVFGGAGAGGGIGVSISAPCVGGVGGAGGIGILGGGAGGGSYSPISTSPIITSGTITVVPTTITLPSGPGSMMVEIWGDCGGGGSGYEN